MLQNRIARDQKNILYLKGFCFYKFKVDLYGTPFGGGHKKFHYRQVLFSPVLLRYIPFYGNSMVQKEIFKEFVHHENSGLLAAVSRRGLGPMKIETPYKYHFRLWKGTTPWQNRFSIRKHILFQNRKLIRWFIFH